jgi:hypothetical protein
VDKKEKELIGEIKKTIKRCKQDLQRRQKGTAKHSL